MIHRGHANDGRSLRWTSWRRRGDVATSSTWHNFPQPLSVLWNGKLPLYCYSWFNFVGFCFFDSKLKLKDKAKSCRACFFLHVSSSQGQFYICRMQGSSGLHESDTNQDKVQGIFFYAQVTGLDGILSHVHLPTEKGAFWLVLTSFSFCKLSWTHGSHMKLPPFWIRLTYALCAFENFLGT